MKSSRSILCRLAGILVLLAGAMPALSLAGATFPDSLSARKVEQAGPPSRNVVTPNTPLSREEIEEDIQALEEERARLLAKYSTAHPDVRSVERRLQVRRKQLETQEQAAPKKFSPAIYSISAGQGSAWYAFLTIADLLKNHPMPR